MANTLNPKRHSPHHLLPPLLPLHPAQNPGCPRPHPPLRRRCRARNTDRPKDSDVGAAVGHEFRYGGQKYGGEGADGGAVF